MLCGIVSVTPITSSVNDSRATYIEQHTLPEPEPAGAAGWRCAGCLAVTSGWVCVGDRSRRRQEAGTAVASRAHHSRLVALHLHLSEQRSPELAEARCGVHACLPEDCPAARRHGRLDNRVRRAPRDYRDLRDGRLQLCVGQQPDLARSLRHISRIRYRCQAQAVPHSPEPPPHGGALLRRGGHRPARPPAPGSGSTRTESDPAEATQVRSTFP